MDEVHGFAKSWTLLNDFHFDFPSFSGVSQFIFGSQALRKSCSSIRLSRLPLTSPAALPAASLTEAQCGRDAVLAWLACHQESSCENTHEISLGSPALGKPCWVACVRRLSKGAAPVTGPHCGPSPPGTALVELVWGRMLSLA